MTDRAVILARGLGTRLRAGAEQVSTLTPGQAAVAAAGVKALMPVGGRPFLDHGLSRLADAGLSRVCLVIGPEHVAVRRYYEAVRPRRVRIELAVQEEARGTADAVAAAADFVGSDPFVVLNGDNLYPVEALRALGALRSCGLAVFESEALVRESNIDAARIAKFAVVELDARDRLTAIHEKPDPRFLAARPGSVWVSMNAWRFDAAIFGAIRSLTPSPRGELELPDAVRRLVARGEREFVAVRSGGAVLDLTGAQDVAALEARLAGVEVDP